MPSHCPSQQPDCKRALFGNAIFHDIAGSEMVIIELAESLIAKGWECHLTAWSMGDSAARLAERSGIRLLGAPQTVKAFQYDLVWLQTRMESLLDFSPDTGEAQRTLFAFAHLDRDWPLAQPGVIVEPLLGQLFAVTSELAVDRVVTAGLARELIIMTRNAAPATFELEPLPRRELANILVVSNHAPPELMETIPRLREAGVKVTHWGKGGDIVDERLTPEAVATADAVITIGKTVPCALRANRPVYIYDHFGGPGWLNRSNFLAARKRNFSGLCTPHRLTGAELAKDILFGFPQAIAEPLTFSEEEASAWRLEDFVDLVLSRQTNAYTPAQHRALLAMRHTEILAEKNLTAMAGEYFGRWYKKNGGW